MGMYIIIAGHYLLIKVVDLGLGTNEFCFKNYDETESLMSGYSVY